MAQIKVIIVDDDPQWLKVIVNFLSRDEKIVVVGTSTTREESLELARSIDFDIVLMDINLSENCYDGIEAAISINEMKKCKIIMLTSLECEELIKNSYIAGAVHYISKLNFKEIPNVIRSVSQRQTPFEIVLKDYHRLKREEQLKALTTAEREIFDLVEQGLSQAEITDRLNKTERTVKNQVNKLLKKLGASSCKQAVLKVMRKGL